MNKKTYLNSMLELREKMYQFYVAYEKVVKLFFRFLGALILFFSVATQFGYEDKLKNPLILLVASVICALTTDSIRVLLVFLFTVVQIYFLSPILAAVVFLAGGILFFLLLHYAPESLLAAAFIPVLLWCKLPCFAAILLGLFFSPASLFSAVSGVAFYYVLQGIKQCESIVQTGNIELFGVIKQVGDSLIYNHELYVAVAMVCIVLLVTYLFRRSRISYSFEQGIIFGTVSSIIVLFMGNLFVECNFSIWYIVVGSFLSGIVAYIVHFFHMVLDYGDIEEVQFEDDDYFYYVRAVPKMKMTVEERTVKHIYTNKEHSKKEMLSTSKKEKVAQKTANVAKSTPQSRSIREDYVQQDKGKVSPVKPRTENVPAGMQQQQNGDTLAGEHKEKDIETVVHTQQQGNVGNRKRAQRSKHKNRKKSKKKR